MTDHAMTDHEESDVTRRWNGPVDRRPGEGRGTGPRPRVGRAVRRAAAALAAVAAMLLLTAAPSFAAPTLQVSATQHLTNGQTVTISGSGFQSNLKSIAIGQCVKGYTGPADCNTSGGATFKNADASGSVSSFTIVVKEKFGSHDCTKEQCVIAGAPLPTTSDKATVAANTYVVDITFGAGSAQGAASSASAAPATQPVAQAPATQPAAQVPVATTMANTATVATAATVTVSGPQTGASSGDGVIVLLLGAGALVVGGIGVVLLLPRRGRTGTSS